MNGRGGQRRVRPVIRALEPTGSSQAVGRASFDTTHVIVSSAIVHNQCAVLAQAPYRK